MNVQLTLLGRRNFKFYYFANKKDSKLLNHFSFTMINSSETVIGIESPEVVAVEEVGFAVPTGAVFSFIITRACKREPEKLGRCQSICPNQKLLVGIILPFFVIFESKVEVIERYEVFNVIINRKFHRCYDIQE